MIPITPIEPLMLPQLGPHHDDLWTTLCDLGDAHHEDWVIIGGQMVMLHALQAGREPGRISQDLDAVIALACARRPCQRSSRRSQISGSNRPE